MILAPTTLQLGEANELAYAWLQHVADERGIRVLHDPGASGCFMI